MRTIGLIGGMSWESTAIYYRLLNEGARARLGGLHSAKLLLASFDFAEIEALQRPDRWHEAGQRLGEAAATLQRAGAECLLICANTMHKVAPAVTGATRIPLIHIVDTTAKAVVAAGARRPLLLATRYVMEEDFYLERLVPFGLQPRVPVEADRIALHTIIFEELVRGIIRPESKARLLEMIAGGTEDGCDSVIFGCTEICMLLQQSDLTLPAFDGTRLHAEAALDFALAT